jgi:ESCRT-II complex subunit VPS25
MIRQSNLDLYCCIGVYPKNGLKFFMTGCVHFYKPPSCTTSIYKKATSTGQLNTILTFYEITDPPVESPLTGLPISLLRKAINILAKSNRAQLIAIADGEGVRFFAGSAK